MKPFKTINLDIDDEPCSGLPIANDYEPLKQNIDDDRNFAT